MLSRASVLAVAAAACLLTACGSSDDSGSSSRTQTAASAADGNAKASTSFERFRECLKDNGVDLPQGGAPGGEGPPSAGGAPPQGRGAPGGPDSEVFEKARQACAKYQPQGAGAGGPGGGGRFDRTAIKAFADCMKEQGVTVKVPSPGDRTAAPPGAAGNGPFGLDVTDKKVAKALQACQSKLPQRQGNADGQQRELQ